MNPSDLLAVRLFSLASSPACCGPSFEGFGKFIFALRALDRLRRCIGRRLVVEVTESGVADQHALSFIHELAALHTIAVDDFGTGDAPLSHMLNLHFS